MKYVALLRGVNVGGKNKVSMSDLRQIFINAGFNNVSTYINSGNVIFETNIIRIIDISKLCESLLWKKLKISAGVAVISADDLNDSLNHAPAWWNNDSNSKHNAIFAIEPASVEEVFKEIGEIKPDYEKIAYYGDVIFWSAPIETFGRTRLSKIVGTNTYGKITIRNANTATKLRDLTRD